MLTRRELVKLGLLGGGYAVLASGSGLRRVFADDELPASPQLQPFQVSLPVPPEPKEVVGGFTSTDCSDFTGSGTRFFQIVEEERSVQIHPALPATPIWGLSRRQHQQRLELRSRPHLQGEDERGRRSGPHDE